MSNETKKEGNKELPNTENIVEETVVEGEVVVDNESIINELEETVQEDTPQKETVVEEIENELSGEKVEEKDNYDDDIVERFLNKLEDNPETLAKLQYKIENLKPQEKKENKRTMVVKLYNNLVITEVGKEYNEEIRNKNTGVLEKIVSKYPVVLENGEKVNIPRDEFSLLDTERVEIEQEITNPKEVNIGTVELKTDDGVFTGDVRESVQKVVLTEKIIINIDGRKIDINPSAVAY